MDENAFDDLFGSGREKSAFELGVKTAKSKAELLDIFSGGPNPPAEDFLERFPELVEKMLRDLPDEAPPSP